MKVTITKHWHDPSGSIGYAEGALDGRDFTASWATWRPIGTTFYDTWLESTRRQDQAIAIALDELNAVPPPECIGRTVLNSGSDGPDLDRGIAL